MGAISFLSRSINGYNEYLILSKNRNQQNVETSSKFQEFQSSISAENPIYFYGFILNKIILKQKVMGIPVWDVAQFIQISGKKYDCVDWNHNISCQLKTNPGSFTFTDHGFCKAKSSDSEPAYPQWNNKSEQTALFSINNTDDIHNLLDAVKNDIYGEINLFILERHHKKNELISLLQKKDQPTLNEVLEKSDLLVDFVFSADSKFQDCMVIKSKKDLCPLFESFISDFKENETVFDSRLEEIKMLQEKTGKK